MAPKQTLHDDDLDPAARTDASAQHHRAAAPANPPPRGLGEARLFQLVGATCAVGGLALAALAGRVAVVGGVAETLGGAGLYPGTVAVAGLVLFAVGRLRRTMHELAERAQERGENDLILEQVAADLLQLRGGFDGLQVTASGVQGDVHALADRVDYLMRQQDESANAPDQGQDAIFRLAASLDQLGARIEGRLKTQYDAFQQGLREVGNEIVGAERELRAALARRPGGARASEGDEADAALSLDDYAGAFPEPHTDPYEEQAVEVDLDSVAQALPAEGSLGVLDTIDDDGMPAPSSGGERPLGFAAPATGFHDAAAVHPQGWEPESKLVVEKSPVERAAELDTRTKLMQLNDLLSDTRLRSMLDEMRRGE